ncbi:MAG: HlyD family efflux transporter periplasmic adaptor subunit [Methylophilaceae bacterium]|jgi:adhesin transport system membrane fusion protein|nr:HlyD family efflux transporter periplasmic adaptor subunit [Methylophilaceae bacterium]
MKMQSKFKDLFDIGNQKDKSHPRSILLFMLLVLIVFVLWSRYVTIDRTVRAQGTVTSEARTQVIQAVDGGALSDIKVREGQTVKAGQVLAVLEKERAVAGFQEASSRVASLKAALIRSEAEYQGKPLMFGSEFAPYPEFVSAQMGFYQQRKQTLEEELRIIREARVWAQQELKTNEELFLTKDVSELEVMRARRQVLDLDAREAQAKNKYLQEARQEAVRLEDELSSNTQRLNERKSVLDHTDIISPVNGVVKFLRINTTGGVLRAGDELMQISPTDSGLLMEVKINPADIASLKTGMPARIRFDAFDYTVYGVAQGEVINISPDTISEGPSPVPGAGLPGSIPQTYYRAQIQIDPKNTPAKIKVKLGMAVTADIVVGERDLFSYMVKPIIKSLSGGLHER